MLLRSSHADARQFRSVRSPIHFNVINVPIARFVSWSNLHLQPPPSPFVHPGVPPVPSRASHHHRNKRVARQRHRSVVTGTVCTCVCVNTNAHVHAAVYIINAYKYPRSATISGFHLGRDGKSPFLPLRLRRRDRGSSRPRASKDRKFLQ